MRLLTIILGGGDPALDTMLTWLALAGGTERISALLGADSGGESASPASTKELKVTGTLVLDEGSVAEFQKRARQ
jgi:hypothetical protein